MLAPIKSISNASGLLGKLQTCARRRCKVVAAQYNKYPLQISGICRKKEKVNRSVEYVAPSTFWSVMMTIVIGSANFI